VERDKMKYSPLIACGYMTSCGIPEPTCEYKFCDHRRWRFDFAWPIQRVALEVEGGVWTGGRHTRGSGFLKDVEKYNAAAAMGWRVVRCEPKTLLTHETIQLLHACLLHNRNDAVPMKYKPKCIYCGREDVE
jgi:hypothetical protein